MTQPKKDDYFDHPLFLVRWHRAAVAHPLVRGGLLALILGTLGVGLYLFALQALGPRAISELVPENAVLVAQGNQVIKEPLPAEGLKEKVADVWLWGHPEGTADLRFYSMEESDEPLNSSLPHSRILQDYFVVGASDEALLALESVEQGDALPLKYNEAYMNLRPRLPYQTDGFIYRLTPWALNEFNELLQAELPQPIALMTEQLMADVFTPTLFTHDDRGDHFYEQLVTYGDKSWTAGGPLFHLNEKYKGDLLSYLPASLKFAVAGQDLATLKSQVHAHFLPEDQRNLVDEMILNKVIQWLPELTTPAEIAPLFSHEYAMAQTENGWILALTLSPDSNALWESIQTDLVSHGLIAIQDNRIRRVPLTAETHQHEGLPYTTLRQENGNPLVHLYHIEGLGILAWDNQDMHSILDAVNDSSQGYTSTLEYDRISPLVDRMDHLVIRDGDAAGVSLFDDGLMVHRVITPSHGN